MNSPAQKQAQRHDRPWKDVGYATRFQGFQNLMRYNVSDILLVSSLYDSYILVEDGRLYESMRKEYEGLNLNRSPEITHASSGKEALELALGGRPFDLIIVTLHIEDMHATRFAELARASGMSTPIVLLAYDNREQSELRLHHDTSKFDHVFIWQGDFRMLLGIVKCIEDRVNVEHDTKTAGVQVILLVEDDVRSYSAFLPIIYTEILKQSQRLIAEGINLFDKYLRMRARPKILLCTTYEEAWRYYEAFAEEVLGIVTDIDLVHNGVRNPRAGIELAKIIKTQHPDIPILLESTDPENEHEAHAIGSSFLLKASPTMLHDLQQFMAHYFSLGDFIFRRSDGSEVGQASDLKSLEDQLKVVPEESIVYHAQRNHFSNWLKARTEFWLAHKLRPRKVTDYPSVEALRQDLISSLEGYRRARQLGQIMDFDKITFDPGSSFARIGGGSLGGKARGLSFVNSLVNNFDLRNRFEGIEIHIPPAVILGTDVFDHFIESNDLRDFALRCTDDAEITRRFVSARRFSNRIRGQLNEFLSLVTEPLAVRSSSLLEDSQYHPFAGVYATYMIPNNSQNPAVRLNELTTAIKRVYASTFYQSAKDYIKVTSYRLEEEKMAVIVQKIVGSPHENRFYPDFSGVARSHNFYPTPPQKPQDGIVSVALGLGRTIVEGGLTVRFAPKYPKHILQFSSANETLRNTQTEFFALNLKGLIVPVSERDDVHLQKYSLDVSERDGTIQALASTYSPENETISDGLSRNGMRVVTFAPILRNSIFPLPEIMELLLDLGSWGMGTPVELEFAVNLSLPEERPKEFGLLQIRPLVLGRETEEVNLETTDPSALVCRSNNVLGNGVLSDLRDVVLVDINTFGRAKSVEVAAELAEFNRFLLLERRPYILIGVGRWGSLDPWLGIPVKWEQIAGARAIVEAGFKDLEVAPSQGSHFFQNITSFMVGYFTVTSNAEAGFVDWDWLLQQTPAETRTYTRRLRFDTPLVVKIDGQHNRGIILKPAAPSSP